MFSNEERTWGMLAHVLTLVINYISGFGWAVGLIMYAMKSKESKFIAFHALQAALFQLIILALAGITACLFFLFFPLILTAIFLIMGFVYPIIGAMKANNGELWEYPFVGKFCRKSVGI